jgi:hypothetical protein
MGYNNIPAYYKTLFAMAQHHKYSLTEVYEMYPYERDIFVELIADFIAEQEKKNNNG